ncbi:MAG: hypothetical protein L0387_35760 [Acidobacteria bacterium]|nr:hypothetical protein [Acidobacteriota bacterium]
MKNNKARTAFKALFATLLIGSCLTAIAGDPVEQKVTLRSMVHINQALGVGNGKPELIDAAGNPIFLSLPAPFSLNKELYTQVVFGPPSPGIFPVLAPDNHQVTLREWARGFGEADINCINEGTKIKMRFEGLTPNGVYTVWHFLDTGAGAMASHPGDINNTFQASADGDAVLSVVATPGPMTFGGVMPACSLTNAQSEFFVVLYHIDGRTCGGSSCADGTDLAQLLFVR